MVETFVDPTKTFVDRVETLVDPIKTFVDRVETLVDPIEPFVDRVEPFIDSVKPVIDGLESSTEIVDGLRQRLEAFLHLRVPVGHCIVVLLHTGGANGGPRKIGRFAEGSRCALFALRHILRTRAVTRCRDRDHWQGEES